MIEIMIQWLAILCFAALTVLRGLDYDWNMCGLNFCLFGLYIFLYLHPIK
jgi:hypothetical protein